jgi:hypothetical protein
MLNIIRRGILKFLGININTITETVTHDVVKIMYDEKDRFRKEAQEVNIKRTICEVIHEMYDLAQTINDPKIKKELETKLEEAYLYGKRMDRRLYAYKHDYDKDMWVDNPDWKNDLKKRKRLYGGNE